MVKRSKRLEKGVESLKEEINYHLSKIEEDINNGKIERGRYHTKEIEKSLIDALKHKLKMLGLDENDKDVMELVLRLKRLNERLEKE